MNKRFIKLLIICVLFAGLFFIFRHFDVDFSQLTQEEFKLRIHSFGIWGPVIFIIGFILRPIVFFPAALFAASAGVIWGVKGFIYVLIAANVSAIIEFLIARYFARDFVERIVKGRMKRLDEGIERNGFITVLLLRLIPNVAFDIKNLALGLTKIKFKDYVLANFLGMMPAMFALVYFGSSIINTLFSPKFFLELILASLILGGVYYFQKYLSKKIASR